MKKFDINTDYYEKLRDLTNNFLKEYLELYRESDLDDIGTATQEEKRESDLFAFNVCLVRDLLKTDYVKDKSFGAIDQPLIGWGFTENLVKETFNHNIRGFLSKFDYTIENLDKKHYNYSEYTIKSNKSTTDVKHFTLINTHNDQKFKCQIKYKNDKFYRFIVMSGKNVILIIRDTIGDDFDSIKQCFNRVEEVDHFRYQFINDINSFFYIFYTVYRGVVYGITGEEIKY